MAQDGEVRQRWRSDGFQTRFRGKNHQELVTAATAQFWLPSSPFGALTHHPFPIPFVSPATETPDEAWEPNSGPRSAWPGRQTECRLSGQSQEGDRGPDAGKA